MTRKTTPAADRGRATLEAKARHLEHFELVWVNRRDIQVNDYNPNQQSPEEYEQLLRSMGEFGFTQPILVNRTTNEIVDGEHRWRASGDVFGEDCTIPVIYVDWDRSRRQIATRSHNRARGSEIEDRVAAMMRELQDAGMLDLAIDVLMIDPAELDSLLGELPRAEDIPPPIDYAAPAPPPARHAALAAAPEPPHPGELAGAAAPSSDPGTAHPSPVREPGDSLYQITLTFTSEEGAIVRRVLGEHPAAKVLELCMLADRDLLRGDS